MHSQMLIGVESAEFWIAARAIGVNVASCGGGLVTAALDDWNTTNVLASIVAAGALSKSLKVHVIVPNDPVAIDGCTQGIVLAEVIGEFARQKMQLGTVVTTGTGKDNYPLGRQEWVAALNAARYGKLPTIDDSHAGAHAGTMVPEGFEHVMLADGIRSHRFEPTMSNERYRQETRRALVRCAAIAHEHSLNWSINARQASEVTDMHSECLLWLLGTAVHV
jgi:hypothetical protein